MTKQEAQLLKDEAHFRRMSRWHAKWALKHWKAAEAIRWQRWRLRHTKARTR